MTIDHQLQSYVQRAFLYAALSGLSLAHLCAGSAQAQEQTLATQGNDQFGQEKPGELRVGGNIGMGFSGDVFTLNLQPVVSYLFIDRIEPGVGVSYQYALDKRADLNIKQHAIGGRLFLRGYILQGLFLSAEGLVDNVRTRRGGASNSKVTLGNLLLGGGYSLPMAGRARLFISASINVFTNVLYPDRIPIVSMGVAVGL